MGEAEDIPECQGESTLRVVEGMGLKGLWEKGARTWGMGEGCQKTDSMRVSVG